MSPLELFDQQRHGVLSRSNIAEVSAIRIYYVFAGRNAWHSTWIQRYTAGCMHPSMQSAKNHAEKQRVQGSVFNIVELPAVLGKSDAGAIIATQINEDRPLSRYSPNALSATHPEAKLIEGAMDNYLVSGAPALGLALTFSRDSRFWRSLPPAENSVFRMACRDHEVDFEPLGESELVRYSSRSSGSQYYLGWSRAKGTVKFNGTEVFDYLKTKTKSGEPEAHENVASVLS